MREDEEGTGLLIEAVRCPTLYTLRAAQRRVQSPPKLPDRRRIFPDQTSAVRDRDPPSEKSEDWGMSAGARIQSSASSLRECQPERKGKASRLTRPVRRCRARGVRRGSTEVYATSPLGGAPVARRCTSSFCLRCLQDSVSQVAERTKEIAWHVLVLTWRGMSARLTRTLSNLLPSRYISI